MRTLAHIGIPSAEKRENSTYLEGAKLYVSDPSVSKNKFEFLYFEVGSPMPEILKHVAHLAYDVDDLEKEMGDAQVIMPPFEPFPGVKAAFIYEEGMPIELMEKIG